MRLFPFAIHPCWKVNVDVAAMLARAAKAQGVKNFVHVSALAADPDSPSRWAQTKV